MGGYTSTVPAQILCAFYCEKLEIFHIKPAHTKTSQRFKILHTFYNKLNSMILNYKKKYGIHIGHQSQCIPCYHVGLGTGVKGRFKGPSWGCTGIITTTIICSPTLCLDISSIKLLTQNWFFFLEARIEPKSLNLNVDWQPLYLVYVCCVQLFFCGK